MKKEISNKENFLEEFEREQKVIITKDLEPNNSHLRALKKYCKEHLINDKDILGIIATGSVAKGIADKYSDIDLIVITSNSDCGCKEGKFWNGSYTFDLRKIKLSELEKADWSIEMKEAYGSGRIIFDDGRKISHLINRKARFRKSDKTLVLVRCLIKLACVSKTVESWRGFMFSSEVYKKVKRGFLMSAQVELSESVDYLLQTIFILNDRIIPEKKRRVEFVFELAWCPQNFEKELSRLIMVEAFSLEDILERVRVFNTLFNQIMEKVDSSDICPANIYKYYLEKR